MSKKKDLSPDLKAECDAAKALFTSRKNALGLTQAKIAEAADISPAAVAMYLNGQNPLNAKFAAVLSRLIEVPVEKFSPRLAAEIRQMQAAPSSGDNSGAAEKVLEMLRKHAGKSLDDTAQGKIAKAVADSLVGSSNVITGDFSRRPTAGDEIRIAHYDVRGSLGGGQQVQDYPEVVQDLTVSQSHLRELGVTYKDASHLKMITGFGQSMEPTIHHLDPMIVDVSIRDFNGDGIYALIWQGHFYVKRLQIADEEHFEMISDNPMHPPRKIRMDDTYIQARVLLVWNAKKL
ncbi:LexA family transcriptional regulator [Pseudomonas sp. 5P_3.1_Bac2]|uniref:LexA family transcriptional regulator n=1 Tax=Pseudomonas sp. 5P_3.1_Bac2 TaxID=2971617 RepID=UPI0021C7E67E|nr:LexA family transcriptional regulator [Pseudomonas sp. 5P_3.1_Bac2]MCU1717341.1 LexA family transcriptional regulator [Pseudomonas sp. 5P_3.1_Bac2]